VPDDSFFDRDVHDCLLLSVCENCPCGVRFARKRSLGARAHTADLTRLPLRQRMGEGPVGVMPYFAGPGRADGVPDCSAGRSGQSPWRCRRTL